MQALSLRIYTFRPESSIRNDKVWLECNGDDAKRSFLFLVVATAGGPSKRSGPGPNQSIKLTGQAFPRN
jgi:hypothetical protein